MTEARREKQEIRELASYLVAYYVLNDDSHVRKTIVLRQHLSQMVDKMLPVAKRLLYLTIDDERQVKLEGMPSTVDEVFQLVAKKDKGFLRHVDEVVFNLYQVWDD